MLSRSGITLYSARGYLLTSAGRSFPRPHLVSLTCPVALAVESKSLVTGVHNSCLEVPHRIINITIDRVVQGWAHDNYACAEEDMYIYCKCGVTDIVRFQT